MEMLRRHPLGTIFGARYSPGWYMQPGECRARLAEHMPSTLEAPLTDLASQIRLPNPPSSTEAALFQQACADTIHQGIRRAFTDNPEFCYPTFVDNTSVAHIQRFFL